MGKCRVMAVAAHPDDIEFMMAGTLLLLQDAGAEIHMWNLANGSCGSMCYSREETIRLRRVEAENSARLVGAIFHPPLVDDLDILYTPALLRQVTAGIRAVQPDILLAPSPEDYMEDHMQAARLAVSGAFFRNMPNYRTDPEVASWDGEVVVYHSLPQGLRDGMRRRIRPESYVDISASLERKTRMLEAHRSQKDWLDASQGVGSYVAEMARMAQEVGAQSGRYRYAEGWRRHSHLGFHADPQADPLADYLGERCWVDPGYADALG